MNINPISFGQTYLTPSLKYMSPDNRRKLKYSYALGQIYPNDVYLGATKNGDLTIQITGTTIYKHLLINNLIPATKNNVSLYLLNEKLEQRHREIYGPKYPITKSVIKYLDYIPEDTLAHYIASEIEDYNHKYGHLFIN